jgi:hypothetical protein
VSIGEPLDLADHLFAVIWVEVEDVVCLGELLKLCDRELRVPNTEDLSLRYPTLAAHSLTHVLTHSHRIQIQAAMTIPARKKILGICYNYVRLGHAIDNWSDESE